jgi:tetratricopeptide (TPR) repeat protein
LIGDYSGAAKAYRAHFQEEFQTGKTTGNPGLDALLRGELTAAKDLSQKTLEKNPEDIGALLNLGEAALEENDLKHALEISDRIFKKQTDHPDASVLASLAFARSGDDSKAIDAINRTLRRSRIGSRLTAFLMFLETTGDKARLPDKEKPLCLLANYYRYLRIYDESNGKPAITYAEKAIVAGDHPADAYLAIGIVHEKEGRPEKALQAFLKAIEADPKQAEAYRWAASVYAERGGDLLNEYRMWKGAYEAAPGDLLYTDAYVQFLQGRLGDLKQALTITLKTLEVQPDNPVMLHRAGELYQWLGEHEQAIGYFQKLLTITPKDAGIYDRLGYSLAELKRIDEAVTSFKTALSLNPNGRGSHVGLAWIYQGAHRFKEAIPEYEKALELGEDVDTLAALCSLYHYESQYQRAADCFQMVIAQDPIIRLPSTCSPIP